MSSYVFWRIGLVAVAAAAIAPTAVAQHVIFNAPGLMGSKKKDELPPVRPQPTVWPRLDPGAVLCRTEDDLDRHAANMEAQVNGGQSQPADCKLIAQPTGIQILSREGLGRTEVKLTVPGGVTGWTDAWLPDKAPTNR